MNIERDMTGPERELVEQMLGAAGRLDLIAALEQTTVQSMNDGGMGSLRFAPFIERHMGSQLAQIEFADADGVPASTTLNPDAVGALFELDVFKGDFSPLLAFPGRVS